MVPNREVGPATRRRPPWLTLAMLAGAAGAHAFPALGERLVYDRALIAGGEIWRAWTGHLVHHGSSHLLWNVAVFAPAGVWLERMRPLPGRTFLVLAPLVISVVLLLAAPSLLRYGGLSGVAAGLVVLLALVQLTIDPRGRWTWLAVLAVVGAKLAYELASGRSAAAELPPGIRNVPEAHLAGVGWALILFAGFRWCGRVRSPPSGVGV